MKVMFLCAVVRPHFNCSANSWWHSNLGIWPIGDWEQVKWNSKNRPKGTLVWKNKTISKEVYQDLLISKLIPAILENWLRWDRLSRKVSIQQDRAKLTFMRMTSCSMMHWQKMESMLSSTWKQQTHLMSIYWIWAFL